MEVTTYIRPSEKFGDAVVLAFAIFSGILKKEATIEDVTEELRKKYDFHMERPPALSDKEKIPFPKMETTEK